MSGKLMQEGGVMERSQPHLNGYSPIEKLRAYKRAWAAKRRAKDIEAARAYDRKKFASLAPRMDDVALLAVAREKFAYDPDTGVLRLKSNGNAVGVRDRGYYKLKIQGRWYKAHRIAWLLTHGPLAAGIVVDHANRNGFDNRLVNLRRASIQQNSANRSAGRLNLAGFRGVSPSVTPGRWWATITINRKHIHLGTFASPEAAARAYDVAVKAARGEFGVTNVDLGLLPALEAFPALVEPLDGTPIDMTPEVG